MILESNKTYKFIFYYKFTGIDLVYSCDCSSIAFMYLSGHDYNSVLHLKTSSFTIAYPTMIHYVKCKSCKKLIDILQYEERLELFQPFEIQTINL